MLKAVIFDCDGILVDSMKYHAIAWQQALAEYDIKVSHRDIFLVEGMSSLDTINLFANKQKIKLSAGTKDKIQSNKRSLTKKIFQPKIYPYLHPLINKLKKDGLILAVVSGGNRDFVKNVVKAEFPKAFKAVITGDDVKHSKPSPAPYRLALKKLGFKPSEAIVIENSPLGIESAKKAKIKTFALATTLNKKYLKQADRVFPNHKKLLTFLKIDN